MIFTFLKLLATMKLYAYSAFYNILTVVDATYLGSIIIKIANHQSLTLGVSFLLTPTIPYSICYHQSLCPGEVSVWVTSWRTLFSGS